MIRQGSGLLHYGNESVPQTGRQPGGSSSGFVTLPSHLSCGRLVVAVQNSAQGLLNPLQRSPWPENTRQQLSHASLVGRLRLKDGVQGGY